MQRAHVVRIVVAPPAVLVDAALVRQFPPSAQPITANLLPQTRHDIQGQDAQLLLHATRAEAFEGSASRRRIEQETKKGERIWYESEQGEPMALASASRAEAQQRR